MAISEMCFKCPHFPCLADDDDRHEEARAKKTIAEVEAMHLIGDYERIYSGDCVVTLAMPSLSLFDH